MYKELYSVEQVADRLGLHVKTVRNYVRDGRLKAVRIGKQYRIAREDLAAMTGRPIANLDRDEVQRTRHVEASSIIEVDAISPAAAIRIANALVATANGRGQGDQPMRIQTIYY